MHTDAILISDILSLPPEKKAEIAEHVERLKTSLSRNGQEKHPRRRAGSLPGVFILKQDFDEPLEEFEDYR